MGSSYGIRGGSECFLPPKTPKAFLTISPVYPEGGSVAASPAGKLEAPHQDMIIKLKGVDDRDAANLLRIVKLSWIHRSCLSLKRVTTLERPDGLPGSNH